MQRFDPSPAEIARLRDLLEVQLLQQWKAAEQMGWSVRRIERLIPRLGIQTQRTGPRAGPGHPEWQGGRQVDKHGYILVYRPDHPHARLCGRGNRGRYVAEHRLVMEAKLGRYLRRGEVVHHRDGNPANNDPANLKLFASNAAHLRTELSGKCPKWTPEGKIRIAAGLQRRIARQRLVRDAAQSR